VTWRVLNPEGVGRIDQRGLLALEDISALVHFCFDGLPVASSLPQTCQRDVSTEP
jgi:hypothetical protein